MKIYFLLLLLLSSSLICMENLSTEKQAAQWLEQQDFIKLMNLIGPKLKDKINCFLKVPKNKPEPGETVFEVWGEFTSDRNNFYQRAYRIKQLAESEIDPSTDRLLKDEAEFCLKLFMINQLLHADITEQKVKGTGIKTIFKEGNSLSRNYINKVFSNAFQDTRPVSTDDALRTLWIEENKLKNNNLN